MTGIITASMPVFVVENRLYGNHAYATINEGLGKVLRFGANDISVVARSQWLAAAAGPLFGSCPARLGGHRSPNAHGPGAAHGRRDASAQYRCSALLVRR